MLFTVFVLVVAFTRFISLGSVTCVFLFPLILSHMNKYIVKNNDGKLMEMYRMPPIVVMIAAMIAFLVIYLHRENIKRIYNGNESKFSLKSKKAEPEEDTNDSGDE